VNSTFDGTTGMPLYYAGLARAQVDWLYGMNLTRMATILGKQQGMNAVLSAGRVQSAALNIIGVREEEIANFVSKDHYRLKASFTAAETSFSGQWLVPGDLLNPEKLLLDIEPAKEREKTLRARQGQLFVVPPTMPARSLSFHTTFQKHKLNALTNSVSLQRRR
jgi:DNA topoisomerase-3